jgi:RNA polymerase sigma-70 factor (ECF subfamily)
MQAFSILVEKYQGPVLRLCLRHLARADAEDMAQETFVRAFTHIRAFDPQRPLLPWLFTIARRLCIDRLRKKKPVLGNDGHRERVPDPGKNIEQTAAARQEIRLLAAALAELERGPREAVALYHFEGLSYRDIAHALEVPQGTVMTWLHRGRVALRKAVWGETSRSDRRPPKKTKGTKR